MSIWYEREEDQIQQDCADGLITNAEAAKRMRELQRDVRDAALESAQNAYDRELENW